MILEEKTIGTENISVVGWSRTVARELTTKEHRRTLFVQMEMVYILYVQWLHTQLHTLVKAH